MASDAHWYEKPGRDQALTVRIRYAHSGVGCRLKPDGKNGLEVVFDEPQRAVTPGQLAVFSRGEVILGSAWIDKALPV